MTGGFSENNFTFFVDSIKPSVILKSPINNYNTSRVNLTLNWTAYDNLDDSLLCNVTLDGVVNVSSIESLNGLNANVSVNGFRDGNHTWNVTCIDNATNSNISDTWLFYIDNTPPTVTLDIANDSWFNYGEITLLFTATDITGIDSCTLFGNFNGTEYRTNMTKGGISSGVQNSFVINLTNGTYLWDVYCNDTVGNLGYNATNFTFHVDTIKPWINLTHPLNNSYVPSVNVTFNWTTFDNLDDSLLCNLTIDGVVNVSNIVSMNGTPSNASVYNFNASAHYWNVTCWDSANNSNVSAETWLFNFDFAVPAVHLISPLNYSVVMNPNITFRFNVTDNVGIDHCTLYIENESMAVNYSTPLNVSVNITFGAPVGNHNWSVNCTDVAGNVNSSEIWQIIVFNATEFTGTTTDLSQVADLSAVDEFTLEVVGSCIGKMKYLQPLDLRRGRDLNKHVNISIGKVYLNSTAIPELNKSANITLCQLAYTDPYILRDSATCPTSICNELSYSSSTGNMTLNVSHFHLLWTTLAETPTDSDDDDDTDSGSPGGGGGTAPAGTGGTGGDGSLIGTGLGSLDLIPDKIIENTTQGRVVQKLLIVRNTGDVTFNVTLSSETIDASLSESFFELKGGEEKEVTAKFVYDEAGLYTGKILAKTQFEEIEDETPVIIMVESREALFDISLDIPIEYQSVAGGNILKTQITLVNIMGGTVPVTINYVIRSLDGTTVLTETETIEVESQVSYMKSFTLPSNISYGEYAVAAYLNYQDSYAVASGIFDVIDAERLSPAPLQRIVLLLALAGLGAVFYYTTKNSRNILLQKK